MVMSWVLAERDISANLVNLVEPVPLPSGFALVEVIDSLVARIFHPEQSIHKPSLKKQRAVEATDARRMARCHGHRYWIIMLPSNIQSERTGKSRDRERLRCMVRDQMRRAYQT
jgi:hypothetical protein